MSAKKPTPRVLSPPVFVVKAVVEDGNASKGAIPLVSEKECGLGMPIERMPLRVQPEAVVHL